MSKSKDMNWPAIIATGVSLVAIVLSFLFAIKANEEEKKRIDAQNRLAEQSNVIRENENSWSRLATQYENLSERLDENNNRLADLIKSRDEQILSISRTVANIRPVVIHDSDPIQTQEEGRTRIDFDEVQDPIRVSGYTLSNPAEAEVRVSYTRPLRLTSVVTQQPDGSWRSYVESDWDNLDISAIETSVNPLPPLRTRPRNRIIVGGSFAITPNRSFDSFNSSIYFLGETNRQRAFSIGPEFTTTTVSGQTRFGVGLQIQFRPWGRI